MIKQKRAFIITIILLISTVHILGKKLADLPELTKFFHITVGDKYIYISDGKAYKIRIYSKENYKYIKSFGNHGEGPGEFVNYPNRIYIRGNKLLIINNREVFFTLDGKLIKERTMRIKYPKPVLNGFVGIEFEKIMKLTRFKHPYLLITTYDNEFKKIKTIYKIIGKRFYMDRTNEFECFPIYQNFDVTEDRIIVYDPQKGFYFKIYNSRGIELYGINLPYKKKKVTQQMKNKELKRIKTVFGKNWELFKTTKWIFPDYLPAYMGASVFDNKIYAKTYNTKNDLHELLVIDLNGKILGKSYVPRKMEESTIKDGIYYYIKDGQERWELHSIMVF